MQGKVIHEGLQILEKMDMHGLHNYTYMSEFRKNGGWRSSSQHYQVGFLIFLLLMKDVASATSSFTSSSGGAQSESSESPP